MKDIPPIDNPYEKPSVRNYALGILTLVYTFNFVDRQLLSILQEAIKAELLLSDAQLGLLTGFAFAMFYVTAGVPIARFADRSNRRNIVAASVGLWSFMTAISGFVQTIPSFYWHESEAGLVRLGEVRLHTPSFQIFFQKNKELVHSLSTPLA